MQSNLVPWRLRSSPFLCIFAAWVTTVGAVHSASSQDTTPRATNGQATTETYVPEPRAYLFGDWNGERTRLSNKGIVFDAFVAIDALSDVTGGYSQSNTAWDRIHASVDLDLGKSAHLHGTTFHARGAFQRGADLGDEYIGALANPSSLVSVHATRLDSWWLQQSLLGDRLVFRAGQFAGQDSYGVREYGASFLSAPMGYAFGNLGSVYESFDPEGTPAAEVRIIPHLMSMSKSRSSATTVTHRSLIQVVSISGSRTLPSLLPKQDTWSTLR